MKKYLGLDLLHNKNKNKNNKNDKQKSNYKNNNYIKQEGVYDFLFVGCDKQGVELMNNLVNYFNRMYPMKVIINLGMYPLYPDIMKLFKQSVNKMKGNLDFNNKLGIFIGQDGIGLSMCANKIKKIRAAVCNNINDVFGAVTRQNMNVLCMSSALNGTDMINIVESYMRLEFQSVDIHMKCVEKIDKM